MPIIIRDSDSSYSGKRTTKSAGRKTGSKSARSSRAGDSAQNDTTRIILLSLITAAALAFLGWYMGLFGGGGTTPGTADNTPQPAANRAPQVAMPNGPPPLPPAGAPAIGGTRTAPGFSPNAAPPPDSPAAATGDSFEEPGNRGIQ